MAVSVNKSDGNTEFTFTVTQTSTNLDPRLDSWGEYVWTHGFGLIEGEDEEQSLVAYEDATNQQKLDAINKRLKALGRDEANTMEAIKAKTIADAAKTEYDELEEL